MGFNIVLTGSEGQPTDEEFKEFLVQYSDNVAGVEISGYSLDYVENGNKAGYVIEMHDGNTWGSCHSLPLRKYQNFNNVFHEFNEINIRLMINSHFHVQPKHGDYNNKPSD